MRITKILAMIICIMLLFCSCTVQKDTDVLFFCERINKLSDSIEINLDCLYYNAENEYCSFLTVGNLPMILALETDTASTVKALRLTGVRSEDSPLSVQSRTVIFEYFCQLCSVLTLKEPSELSLRLSEEFLKSDRIDFSPSKVVFSDGQAEYFYYSNSELLSLYCSIKV